MLSGSMYVYQKLISPQLSRQCPYAPSCSAYSKDLIRDHGIFKGIVCSADRLMRCNRIALTDISEEDTDAYDHKIHEHTDRYNIKH